MLKTAAPSEMSIFDKLEIGDNEGGDGVGSVENAKKSGKLKGQKLFKSPNPAKSRKYLSKSGNSPNFNTKNSRPSFLTLEARAAFNR